MEKYREDCEKWALNRAWFMAVREAYCDEKIKAGLMDENLRREIMDTAGIAFVETNPYPKEPQPKPNPNKAEGKGTMDWNPGTRVSFIPKRGEVAKTGDWGPDTFNIEVTVYGDGGAVINVHLLPNLVLVYKGRVVKTMKLVDE